MTRTRRKLSGSAPSSLDTYLNEIYRTPLLSAAEERQLAAKIAEGDLEARDHMVRANLRLVVNIARGYAGRGLGLQDLIEEGNLGLMRAVEGFDASMNTRFSTYAVYWIKQSIKRALVNTAKSIRIPAYMVQLLSKWRQASAKLQTELGRPPTHEEVARRLNLPKKKLEIIKKAIHVYDAAPQTEQQSEDGRGIDEMLMDGNAKTPDVRMIEADDLRKMCELLDQMDVREATILRLRFGLDDNEPKTLQEIGERLGLTRERVRQIGTEALNKLCRFLQPDSDKPARLAVD